MKVKCEDTVSRLHIARLDALSSAEAVSTSSIHLVDMNGQQALDQDVLVRRIRRHFGDLLDESANPLVLALALQDTSSVGLQHYAGEFAEIHRDLRGSLKMQVDENYQGFNSSVGAYRSVVASVNQSHSLIVHTQEDLRNVREVLSRRRPMLRDLQQSSLRYKQMLELLDVVEHLKEVPAVFEKRVASKQFRLAHQALGEALETINARNLLRVPAIQSIHSYVVAQQMGLFSTLVDELVSHLYLISPYTQQRWQAWQKDESSAATTIDELSDFVAKLNTPMDDYNPLHQDGTTLVEQDSFQYIRSVLDTLTALDCLVPALDALQSRLRDDFKDLYDRTVAEIVRESGLTPEQLRPVAPSGSILEQFQAVDQRLLRQLATTLYAKFGASLEAHRAVQEVASQLNANYSLTKVCAVLQSEIRSFLLRYVDDGGIPSAGAISGKGRARSFDSSSKFSKSKIAGPIFQFSLESLDSHSLAEFDELRAGLKRSVPGLVQESTAEYSDWGTPFAETSKESRLQVVAPAHILNIRALLEPTAGFLQRARCVVPEPAFDEFLDSFLRDQFVPRLQRAFQRALDEIANSPNALEVIPDWRSRSQLPVARAAAEIVDLAALSCQLLGTGEHYREDYTVLLVDILEMAQEYLDQWVRDLFVTQPRRLVLDLTQSLRSQLAELREACEHDAALATKDIDDLAAYLDRRHTPRSGRHNVIVGDLLDAGTFRTLALLATSAEWMNTRLRAMRRVDSRRDSRDGSLTSIRKRWTLLDASLLGRLGDRHPVAVLAGAQLARYDRVVNDLDDLCLQIVSVLRVDSMLRTVYYFDQMVLRSDYKSRRPREERDPAVERLQRDLSSAAQTCQVHLTTQDAQFALHGLAQLMNELFILESENIADMNEAGHDKMCTNIFALQQMLTSIVGDPRDVDFTRAANFYDLFRLTPTLILDRAREGEADLTIDDLKLLLRTKHRTSGVTAGVSLTEHLAQLDAIFAAAKNGDKGGTPKTPTASVAKAVTTGPSGPIQTSPVVPAKTAVQRTPQSSPRVRSIHTNSPSRTSPRRPPRAS